MGGTPARPAAFRLSHALTELGYPNEHLGRSKIDSVKSPMYATSVGLVLAGYQPLDQRVERYTSVEEQPVYQKQKPQPEPKSTTGGNNGGGGLLQKLKGFLSDDIDNKQSY